METDYTILAEKIADLTENDFDPEHRREIMGELEDYFNNIGILSKTKETREKLSKEYYRTDCRSKSKPLTTDYPRMNRKISDESLSRSMSRLLNAYNAYSQVLEAKLSSINDNAISLESVGTQTIPLQIIKFSQKFDELFKIMQELRPILSDHNNSLINKRRNSV